MGRKLIDRTGLVFNGITIVSLHSTSTGRSTKWNCICHCGNEFTTTYNRLESAKTKSCGCERHPSFIDDHYTYSSYNAMIQRCTNINNGNYSRYGAIGVTVCEEWLQSGGSGYAAFLNDMGHRPKNTSINRINSSMIYSKDTCEWASATMQAYDQIVRKDNPSGIPGVKYRTDRNKWTSFIYVGNQYINLYYGDSEIDAISARRDAELKYYGR